MAKLKLTGIVRDAFSQEWLPYEEKVRKHPEMPVNPDARFWFEQDDYRLPLAPRQKTQFEIFCEKLLQERHDFNSKHKYSALVVSFNEGGVTAAAIPQDMDMIRKALEHLNGTVECEIEQHEEGHWFVTKLNPAQGLW